MSHTHAIAEPQKPKYVVFKFRATTQEEKTTEKQKQGGGEPKVKGVEE